jgi:hypothetical protein
MPTIAKLPSGSWRAQVRRKGRYVSETFLRRDDALRWSRLAELSVDRNETPVSDRIDRLTKFGELLRLPIEDMTAVGKPPRRSKAATLDMLQRELGAIKIAIEQVSLVTGHKDWKMLRRYTHLKPEALHEFARRA